MSKSRVKTKEQSFHRTQSCVLNITPNFFNLSSKAHRCNVHVASSSCFMNVLFRVSECLKGFDVEAASNFWFISFWLKIQSQRLSQEKSGNRKKFRDEIKKDFGGSDQMSRHPSKWSHAATDRFIMMWLLRIFERNECGSIFLAEKGFARVHVWRMATFG